MNGPRSNPEIVPPRRWIWLIRWFRWYVNGFVRKNMHAVRLSKTSAMLPTGDEPLIVVLNHPSWWDPMIGIVLFDRFGARDHYAPIHQRELNRYRFFRRLGFFGIDPENPRSAVKFLRMSEAILAQPRAMLWITAQGEFSDVRQRPIELRNGVGHLAARLGHGIVIPLALEYVYWTEKTPEALARFGTPIPIDPESRLDGKAWTARIAQAVSDNMDALASEAMSRNPGCFVTLLEGRSGVGGIYDTWRNFRAWLTGESFTASHDPKE